jgi:hypothetical protein
MEPDENAADRGNWTGELRQPDGVFCRGIDSVEGYGRTLPPTAERIHGDRRSGRRFRIALVVRWKLLRRNKLADSGTGRTVDLSRGGILFDPGCKLPIGHKVCLSIAWPVLLHNAIPMQLTVEGRIVRSGGTRVAVQIAHYEFRTAGMGSAPPREMAPVERSPLAFRAVGSPLRNLN